MLSKSSFTSKPDPESRHVRRRWSKTKLWSLFLAICVAAVSVALIAHTASSVLWMNDYVKNGNGPVALGFQNYSYPDYSYGYGGDINNATWRNYINYKDPNVGMTDTYALLAAGVIGTICAALVLAIPFCLQDNRSVALPLGRSGRMTSKLHINSRTLTTALDALLTLLFLAISILVWIHFASASYAPGIYDLPDRPLDHTIQHGIAGRHTTFESWNCALTWQMATNARKPSQGQIMRQCNNATISRQLIIALLALALARLSVWPMGLVMRPVVGQVKEFREWRSHTRAMREGKGTELDERSGSIRAKRIPDEEAGKVEEDRGSVHEADDGFIAELPGCRLSTIEMDEDAARAEMPGAEGGKEMDAGVAAVEKDAGVKS